MKRKEERNGKAIGGREGRKKRKKTIENEERKWDRRKEIE